MNSSGSKSHLDIQKINATYDSSSGDIGADKDGNWQNHNWCGHQAMHMRYALRAATYTGKPILANHTLKPTGK